MAKTPERREYQRVVVELPCTIFINGEELVGVLQDVSEKGACLVISDKKELKLKIGDRLTFQFCDTVVETNIEEVFGGVARIERIATPSDIKTVVGVSVHNRSFYYYVGAKKTSRYLKHLLEIRSASYKKGVHHHA